MIPRIFHFIFGLKEQTEPFHLQHYLCLESCRQVNQPDAIYFHYANEPYGPLWEKIKPHLRLRSVQREALPQAAYKRSAEGRLIAQAGWSYAHEADFIRLKVLLEHGGVYADMDTLFVQPYPDHLFRHDCVLGEEGALPDARGVLRPSLCNAVIMARPGAPFVAKWLEDAYEAFDGTWTSHSCQLATQLWEAQPDLVHVVPRRYFYRHPWTRAGIRSLFEHNDPDLRDVFSLHLWNHLWWDEKRTDFTRFHGGALTEDYVRSGTSTYAALARRFLPRSGGAASLADYLSRTRPRIPFKLFANATLIQQGMLEKVGAATQPLVSCLMVTRGKLFSGRHAVDCFRRQTYPNRELVLVCDAPGTEIEAHCRTLGDPRIRVVYPDKPAASLGKLRNLSMQAAQGSWICQWDDDDLYHPERLALGMAVAHSMQADALFLNRWLLWSPARRRIGISGAREWEGSMLARKESVPAYPALTRGEDTAVMHAMFRAGRIALIDTPWLYTYIQTGANTWTANHFEAIWQAASAIEPGEGYEAALAACASFGPYQAYAQDAAELPA